jgi:hypothetical protein
LTIAHVGGTKKPVVNRITAIADGHVDTRLEKTLETDMGRGLAASQATTETIHMMYQQ